MPIDFKPPPKPIVVVGIGNTLKGDDGAGPKLIELLASAAPALAAQFIDAGITPENYIGKIIKLGPATIFLADAIDFGGQPGEIKQFAPGQIKDYGFTTHSPGLNMFFELIQSEVGSKNHPANVIIIGIQPKQANLGQALSSEIEAAIANLAKEIVKCMKSD
ncbi:MAG: hydrogenase 3 maturation endopeptidase HyCI [Candidatus Margulisiibacteriota bacterium]